MRMNRFTRSRSRSNRMYDSFELSYSSFLLLYNWHRCSSRIPGRLAATVSIILMTAAVQRQLVQCAAMHGIRESGPRRLGSARSATAGTGRMEEETVAERGSVVWTAVMTTMTRDKKQASSAWHGSSGAGDNMTFHYGTPRGNQRISGSVHDVTAGSEKATMQPDGSTVAAVYR